MLRILNKQIKRLKPTSFVEEDPLLGRFVNATDSGFDSDDVLQLCKCGYMLLSSRGVRQLEKLHLHCYLSYEIR